MRCDYTCGIGYSTIKATIARSLWVSKRGLRSTTDHAAIYLTYAHTKTCSGHHASRRASTALVLCLHFHNIVHALLVICIPFDLLTASFAQVTAMLIKLSVLVHVDGIKAEFVQK